MKSPENTNSATPAFGDKVAGVSYTVRRGAYAVIFDAAGRVAAIRGAGGCYLPGGGLEDGETPGAALRREFLEECGAVIEILGALGEAVDYLYAAAEKTYFEKRGVFYLARFASAPDAGALEWLARDDAVKSFRQEGHAWAVARAAQATPGSSAGDGGRYNA